MNIGDEVAFDRDAAVAALLDARRTGLPLAALPENASPRSQVDANAVQDEVARRLGPVIAWKVGATKAGPFRSPINAETVFFNTASLPSTSFHLMKIEAEIAFRFAKALPAREAPWARSDILDSIGSVHPAYEICDTRFTDFGTQDRLSHWADQLNHGALIVGTAAALEPAACGDYDFVNQPVTLDINGERQVDAIGGNPAGDPIALLVWMANEGSRSFGGLNAGDVITTGSYTGAITIAPGASIRAEFAGIGAIELALAE